MHGVYKCSLYSTYIIVVCLKQCCIIPAASDYTTSPTQREVCPSSSVSIVLASVITAIATALLATVIFVLVQIAVCKCHPKFTPGGAETRTSTGTEGQDYEEVDGYMEVRGEGEEGGNIIFPLKKNEAYAMQHYKKMT